MDVDQLWGNNLDTSQAIALLSGGQEKLYTWAERGPDAPVPIRGPIALYKGADAGQCLLPKGTTKGDRFSVGTAEHSLTVFQRIAGRIVRLVTLDDTICRELVWTGRRWIAG